MEATDPGAATSSIAHSLCALNLQVAQLTGIVSDGVTAIQQHLPLAATDRGHILALQEQGVAAIRELTEVMRANGAARSATPRQPGSVPAPEGRYLHGHCGCPEGSGVYWGVDIATGRHAWLLVSRHNQVLYHHCPGCGAQLLWLEQCAAIGQPAGTAVAFAPVTDSGDGVMQALARANHKLAEARDVVEALAATVNQHEPDRMVAGAAPEPALQTLANRILDEVEVVMWHRRPKERERIRNTPGMTTADIDAIQFDPSSVRLGALVAIANALNREWRVKLETKPTPKEPA